tara:strand:- start:116 stop:451 length:336 start_codon:yes stop_codon:yes gene_type:complete
MDSSFYLPPLPPPIKQSSGASLGLWIAIISGTILLGVSFILVWYYLLREKYNLPPSESTGAPRTTGAPGAPGTPTPTEIPCPAGKKRSAEACKMCRRRKYANCSETYCKCI